MSAGAFELKKYSSDAAVVYNIRVQPETTLFSAQAPTIAGAVTAEPSAIAKGSRRGIGVNARNVRIRFTAAPPAGYATGQTLTVPIFSLAAYAAIKKGDAVTYLGVAAIVVGKTPEYIN